MTTRVRFISQPVVVVVPAGGDNMRHLVIDNFCRRQWDKNYVGTQLVGTVESEVEEYINKYFETTLQGKLHPGYADFCKHVFVPNVFESIKTQVIEITDKNARLLKSGYEARTEKELPILNRWFELTDLVEGGHLSQLPKAKWLDVILYSREQIIKENEAMGSLPAVTATAPWGIISIKGQDEAFELPMTPITMMRNALGKQEGGSGVPMSREEYFNSVRFWEKHAVVKTP